MAGAWSDKPLEFRYRFLFPNGSERMFLVRLDGGDLSLIREPRDEYPSWTELSFHKCPNCPLDEAEHSHCPVATGLTEVIEFFKTQWSSDTVDIEIRTEARTYLKRAPLAMGVSALFGLHMATAGCPILDRLKPMTRTHVPFATIYETMSKHFAVYMLAQFFRARKGKTPDWEMKDFVKHVEAVRTVNKAFVQRLYAVCSKDANLNAIVHLDCFADSAAFVVQKKGLDELEKAFSAYLED